MVAVAAPASAPCLSTPVAYGEGPGCGVDPCTPGPRPPVAVATSLQTRCLTLVSATTSCTASRPAPSARLCCGPLFELKCPPMPYRVPPAHPPACSALRPELEAIAGGPKGARLPKWEADDGRRYTGVAEPEDPGWGHPPSVVAEPRPPALPRTRDATVMVIRGLSPLVRGGVASDAGWLRCMYVTLGLREFCCCSAAVTGATAELGWLVWRSWYDRCGCRCWAGWRKGEILSVELLELPPPAAVSWL